MRLARLAALGLAIGVIAGFAIALLRPRPTIGGADASADLGSRGSTGPAGGDPLWDQFRKAEDASVVELRTHRRVTG